MIFTKKMKVPQRAMERALRGVSLIDPIRNEVKRQGSKDRLSSRYQSAEVAVGGSCL